MSDDVGRLEIIKLLAYFVDDLGMVLSDLAEAVCGRAEAALSC